MYSMVYLYGEIGSGKTSALRDALKQIKSESGIVVVEVNGEEIKNNQWFFYYTINELSYECGYKKGPSKTVLGTRDYVSKVGDILDNTSKQAVIVIENINLMEKKEFNLVSLLLHMHNTFHADLCVMATSRIPWDRFIQEMAHQSASTSLLVSESIPYKIYFEQFTNNEVIKMIFELFPQYARDKVKFQTFLQLFVKQVYPHVRNISEIARNVPSLYKKFEELTERFLLQQECSYCSFSIRCRDERNHGRRSKIYCQRQESRKTRSLSSK
ncbi:hypothetical protein AKO1_015799 [Acrasis kona]|uniref:ORC1/DEAH AAA+ ATPase domain-containing protein n=1 Tax=Acrasis kona TaxID=1008807 RepID=A0AAW2ZIV6_9EUKA